MARIVDICLEMIAGLNAERRWNLDEEAQAAYAMDISARLPQDYKDEALPKIIENYHEDHALVQALLDCHDLQYDAAWKEWTVKAVSIIQSAGLARSTETSVDREDLTQIALAQLVQALPSFRYTSRFSTWAYSVIIRSVRRYLRDQNARKRAGRPLSLDEHAELDVFQGESQSSDTEAIANTLVTLINTILTNEGGERLAKIFNLWVIEDMRPAEIGKHVGLSTSRVRKLLIDARDLLREDPAIQEWREPGVLEAAGRGND